MKITHWIIGLIITLVLTACSTTDTDTSKTEGSVPLSKVSQRKASHSVVGTYYAKLPYYTDSLVVDLLLEGNHAYSMLGYAEKTKKEQYEVGVWQQQGNKITLIPRLAKKSVKPTISMPIRGFLIKKNNQLELLGDQGRPYRKNTYIFKKK